MARGCWRFGTLCSLSARAHARGGAVGRRQAAEGSFRLERIIKLHIEGSMPQEAQPLLRGTSVHHHLVEYQTWRGRFIPPQPRRVHASKELQAKGINLASLRSKI